MSRIPGTEHGAAALHDADVSAALLDDEEPAVAGVDDVERRGGVEAAGERRERDVDRARDWQAPTAQ